MIDFGETFSSPNFEIRDVDGLLADAGTVLVDITKPDGTAVSQFAASHPDTGIYNFDYLTADEGNHRFVITATGGVLGSLIRKWSDAFDVQPADPRFIVSFADAKAHVNVTSLTPAADLEELRLMVGATTTAIEDLVGAVARRQLTEKYDSGQTTLLLREHPVVSVDAVTENGITLAASNWSLRGRVLSRVSGGAAATWIGGLDGIEVQYTVGRVPIPSAITEAALDSIRHFWETQRGRSGAFAQFRGSDDDAAIGAEASQMLLSGMVLPPRAMKLLSRYRVA